MMSDETFFITCLAFAFGIGMTFAAWLGFLLGRRTAERDVVQRELARMRHEAEDRLRHAAANRVRAGCHPQGNPQR